MGADGHVIIYDKQKFKQIALDCFEEFEKAKGIDLSKLRKDFIVAVDKYYSFKDYVIRYVEYGTDYWDTHDWLWCHLFIYHDLDLNEEEIYHLLDSKLEDAEIKDIEVWT